MRRAAICCTRRCAACVDTVACVLIILCRNLYQTEEMPTVGIKRNLLMKALGVEYSEEEFNDLCFEYGLELDEVTSEREMISKEQGDIKGVKVSDEIIYKIDIPANRYDLLCLSGLAQALLIFQQKIDIPTYVSLPSNSPEHLKIIVKPNTFAVRPFVVGALLRNISLNSDTYDSLIDLQDKLHQNICRKRSLVAIGTHDYDTIKGPFIYDAKRPEEIKFVPLNEEKEYTAAQLMDHYSVNSHLKPYLPIIRDKPFYPVIYDSKNVLLSLPPIINGDHSKITLNTKHIFIECTATDENKAKIVLDTIICMFSQYCDPKFHAERVEVVYEQSGERRYYPELNYRVEQVPISKVNKLLNISKSSEEICQILTKMGLKSSPTAVDKSLIDVVIPPTRHDILHVCDILEDVAIAYGYNNIQKTFPKVITIGSQFFLNKLTDQLRYEISRSGYTEALTFSLCSADDIGSKMRNTDLLQHAVRISNPKTIEFEVARTSLLPGLLKTIESNKNMPLPLKLFEISDVVLKDPKKDVGARNQRMLCAVYYNKQPGFEIIHGLLDRLMEVLEVKWTPQQSEGYYIESIDDERFLSGRCAAIICHGTKVGVLGVLHPEVVVNFALAQPCSALEINIEYFMKIFASSS